MTSLITKVLSSVITLFFALIGGIWTAITVLNSTMDSKVAEAETRMRNERVAQISEVKTLVVSLDKKVDILIERGK